MSRKWNLHDSALTAAANTARISARRNEVCAGQQLEDNPGVGLLLQYAGETGIAVPIYTELGTMEGVVVIWEALATSIRRTYLRLEVARPFAGRGWGERGA